MKGVKAGDKVLINGFSGADVEFADGEQGKFITVDDVIAVISQTTSRGCIASISAPGSEASADPRDAGGDPRRRADARSGGCVEVNGTIFLTVSTRW